MDGYTATVKRHAELERKDRFGARIRDFILGWQDGLVNVLGVILGVAVATSSVGIVLVAAIAAAFAESVSMAAVAFTSFKAEQEYYMSEVAREKREMKEAPEIERKEVRDIYSKLGFRGSLLNSLVKHITSDKRLWLKVMMEQELKLYPEKASPVSIAAIVGISALVGSFIPVIPFLLFPVKTAILAAIVISAAVLFCVGVFKARITIGNPIRSGLELAAIGMLAAIVGYAIGALLGATVIG